MAAPGIGPTQRPAFARARNSSMRMTLFSARGRAWRTYEFDTDPGGIRTCARSARHAGIGAQALRHRFRYGGAGLFASRRTRAGSRSGLSVRPRYDARDPRRLRLQPPGDDHRLSRHRQVDSHRADRRPPQLALRAHQPRQPRLPHRSGRQGRDRAQGRQAGHGIPRRHAAVGDPEQYRPVFRRI